MMQTNNSYRQMDQATSVTGSVSDSVPFRQKRWSRHVFSTYIPNHRFSRYHNALVSLLPIRLTRSEELSIQNAGLFSNMTFHWIFKYLWQSWTHAEIKIPLCPQTESCTVNSPRINGLLDDQSIKQGQNNLSIFSVAWRFIRTRTIFACILYILGSLTSILGLIYILPEMLQNCGNIRVYSWMLALVCTELISCFLTSCSNAINIRTAIRLRSACFSSLYRQVMIMSLTYKISSWQLSSFLLSDGQHIQDMVTTFPNLICTPVILTLCMLFAGIHLQLWGYLTVITILFLFPIFILTAILSKNLLHKATFFSDQRIKLLEDFITNNIYVKFFKQDEWFQANIKEQRSNEVKNMKKAGLYDNICLSFILLQPFLSLTALFVAYMEMRKGQDLAQFAAVCIILLIHVKQSLDNFWHALSNFIKGLAALNKFKNLMICETVNFINKRPRDTNLAIHIEDANFQWMKQATLDINSSQSNILCSPKSDFVSLGNKIAIDDILHNINILVEQGKLIGICGPPGSGKSSLLLGVMGLLLQSTGKRRITGHCSYINQTPVIFQDSLRNNILFDSEFDSQKYFRVTMYCELQDFISKLPAQDDTIIFSELLPLEIKQRIILARALYHEGQIYLLDEPLSALDPRSASKVFETVILKSLQDKTVLLVTDNIEFLQQCDQIYMMQQGRIILQGQHDKLLNYNADYTDFITYLLKQKNVCREKSTFLEVSTEIPLSFNDSRGRSHSVSYSMFDSTESLCPDAVDSYNIAGKNGLQNTNAIKSYLLNFGCCSIITLLLGQILNVTFVSFLPLYFFFSLQNKMYYDTYLYAYFGIFLWMLIFGIITNYIFNNKMFSASIRIHNDILQKLYKATFSFFREKSFTIISTISIQQQLTDIDIPRLIYNIFLNLFIAIITSLVIFFASPWNIISVANVFIVMIVCTGFTRRALLPFNQFGMEFTDLIYTQIMTVLMARPIIQAYNKINYFSKSLHASYNKYMVYLYIIHAAKGWLSVILHCLTVLLLACVGFMSLSVYPECALSDLKLFHNPHRNTTLHISVANNMSVKDAIEPTCSENNSYNVSVKACIVLTIVCTLQASYALQRCLSLYLNAGLAFDMLSKVQSFKASITEEETEEEKDSKLELEEKAYNIRFVKATVKQSDIPVINELSLNIKENEKIGFYGLTSSERKAIIALMYKLIELSSGNILIGKKNISKISLDNLRSLVYVIPAEPYLFNLSIRKILKVQNGLLDDPIEVLKKFALFERISHLNKKLDSVADHLLNTEEKHLLCLAQAYIKQSPIIIVEDFVSGSNFEYIITTYLKQLFPQSTVLIFANDVHSLRECDSITVVEEGKVVYSSNAKNVITHFSKQLRVYETTAVETSF